LGDLLLGPIVGHTDDRSSRVWIRVRDDPADYSLRIPGRGSFPFVATESGIIELGTAIATADGLRSEWDYKYHILRRGRVISSSQGSFRTMPSAGSEADMLFVSVSCSHGTAAGAWPLLADYIKNANPRFLIMMGDQIYVDNRDKNAAAAWPDFLSASASERRAAMADKYQEHWSREPIRTILANIPTYMMWDDHDIRNGWGSYAADSPTLRTKYPRGAKIADKYNTYFEDARDLFWHFQMCINPGPPASLHFPGPGERQGTPFVFQAGRLVVMVLDNRGARDLWRDNYPILGDAQWQFLNQILGKLPSNADALALVVPLPLTSVSADGVMQTALGDREDDVDLFKKGDEKGLMDLLDSGHSDFAESLAAAGTAATTGAMRKGPLGALGGSLASTLGGGFELSNLTDVRDNWANHFCRKEQEEILKTTNTARLANRLGLPPRNVVFIGGDLHVGGLFTVSMSNPTFVGQSLVTSGIAQQAGGQGIVGLLMDQDFDIGSGIHAKLETFTNHYNFGVSQIVFAGGTAVITNAVCHQGDSSYWNLKLP
jgi:hypothetical protein